MSTEREQTAIHESGHAVIAKVLGLRVDEVTVEPLENSTAGANPSSAGHGRVFANRTKSMTLTLGGFLQTVDRDKRLAIKRVLEEPGPWNSRAYAAALRYALENPNASAEECINAARNGMVG